MSQEKDKNTIIVKVTDAQRYIVTKDRLLKSQLFHDLCFYDNTLMELPFPNGYYNIAHHYISYLLKQESDCVALSHDELKQCFELCHLIQDDDYLQCLILLYYGSQCDFINTLNENLRSDIYLKSPYQFIAEKYGRDYKFVHSWLSLNQDRKFTIANLEYHCHVEYYDDNKMINKVWTYVDDVNDGVLREWHQNQLLKAEVYYHNKKQHGMEMQWFNNGQLLAQGLFDDGNEEGVHSCFYKSGNICYEYHYKNGAKHGYHKMWNICGELMSCELYYDGVENK
jgi:antitoxin component YwqK of YwqJK toxin-antitoxin module